MTNDELEREAARARGVAEAIEEALKLGAAGELAELQEEAARQRKLAATFDQLVKARTAVVREGFDPNLNGEVALGSAPHNHG